MIATALYPFISLLSRNTMKNYKRRVKGSIYLLAGLCLLSAQFATAETTPVAAVDIYGTNPTPLTPVQCGQCHPAIYKKIKENGKKHRFACQDCHEQLHAYNPIRNNWAEIIPQCAKCHDLPHGKDFPGCLECHSDPHTPLMIKSASIGNVCGTCHVKPNEELTKYPSSHTEQGCATCHTSHGLIPSCLDCHTPHVPEQALAACKACHPVHKPLEIVYDDSVASAPTCGSCHERVFKEWSGTASKHGGVSCAACHNKHGLIPDCQKCHTNVHDEKMLKKFPKCLGCHINVHDLPTKKK